jgi:hypothetical protein
MGRIPSIAVLMWLMMFCWKTYGAAIDVCVVSAVDIHREHFSRFLSSHNITTQKSSMSWHGRRAHVSPERVLQLEDLKRGVIYLSTDIVASARFLVRRHMAMEQSRILHGNERWFASQMTAGGVKHPLFYYSRLGEVNSDKSRSSLKLLMGPEDERMYRILEYVNGNGVDPIGIAHHFLAWSAAALSRRNAAPILFIHMHPSSIGEPPYDAEVGAVLHKFLGLQSPQHSHNLSHYTPTFDTRMHYDVRKHMETHGLSKKPFAGRVLNGTAVLDALSAEMQKLSGKVFHAFPPDKNIATVRSSQRRKDAGDIMFG